MSEDKTDFDKQTKSRYSHYLFIYHLNIEFKKLIELLTTSIIINHAVKLHFNFCSQLSLEYLDKEKENDIRN